MFKVKSTGLILTLIALLAGCDAQVNLKGFANKNESEKHKTAVYAGWNSYTIPGICAFQAPPTLEIKGEELKELSDALSKMQGLPVDPNRVILQQKGQNDYDRDSFEKYCRVIISATHGHAGEYPRIRDKIEFSEEDLEEIDEMVMAGFSQQETITIIEYFSCRIVSINGIDAISYSYKRETLSEGKSPMIVTVYSFFNYNKMHTITLSYRQTEAHLWKDDLEKMIYTFSFVTD